MVYRVDLTARAVRDLRHIFEAINAENSMKAAEWFSGLEAAILALENQPHRHPAAPEKDGLRHILHSSRSYVYRVIFKVDDVKQVVSVLHIRHGSRQAF
ncbi:MAG TPA: type II toxin-antitoxin system RelE/ParE family toxin [Asticcacaulis sp.]|nr:type II toxin-antitoxin system RelE/ParE family toxin [Asticcacaulis sp.]